MVLGSTSDQESVQAGEVPKDGDASYKRSKYNYKSEKPEVKSMPGVTYLSDLLKVIDTKRQTGFTDEDLPHQFRVPKSFVEVPHDMLGKDGYPPPEHWDHPACQASMTKKGSKKTNEQISDGKQNEKKENELRTANKGICQASMNKKGSKKNENEFPMASERIERDLEKARMGKPDRPHNRLEVGIIEPETASSIDSTSLPSKCEVEQPTEFPISGKVRRSKKPRHPIKAQKATAERTAAVSAKCESKKEGNPFYREFRRYDDPVLPIEDYNRTMEIVSKLYYIYDHGHGQFVEYQTKKLICTYQFDDLESMRPEIRQEHQQDFETVLKATELFNLMPLNRPSHSNDPLISNIPSESTILKRTPDTQATSDVTATAAHAISNESSRPQAGRDASSVRHIKTTRSGLISAYRASLEDGDDSPLTSLPSSDSEDGTQLQAALDHENQLIIPLLARPGGSKPAGESTDQRSSSPLTPLKSSESEDEEDQYQTMPESLRNAKDKAQPTTNSALIHGQMFCFGGRAGYAKAILFSPYITRQGASLSLYELFLSELPNFGDRVGSRYETFADNAFFAACKQLNELGVASMSSVSKHHPRTPHDFAGNFAFTLHNFYNKPHTDNDKGKVYCVWYPIDSMSRRIVTTADGFRLEGGFFLFPEYRIAFNFGVKYVVQIAWSGKSTFHQTLPSKENISVGPDGTETHYTRLGCSSQITSSMARAAVKLGTKNQYNFRLKCDRKILDCEDVLNLKGKKWKP